MPGDLTCMDAGSSKNVKLRRFHLNSVSQKNQEEYEKRRIVVVCRLPW